MKKTLLLMVVAFMTSVASFAQWVKPEVPTTGQPLSDGLQCYILNVESGSFYTGATVWHSWDTSAGVAAKGQLSVIKKNGGNWNICRASDDKHTFISGVLSAENGSAEGRWEMHVDMVSQGHDAWEILEFNGDYRFRIAAEDDTYGADGTNLPEATDWATLFVGHWVGEDAKYPNAVYANVTEEEGGINWRFISEEDYDSYFDKITLYEAAMDLKKAIEDAEAEYPGIDLTAAKQVYENTGSTLEQLQAALKLIDEAKFAYLLAQMGSATPSEPYDVTGLLANPSFEDGLNGWTYSKKGPFGDVSDLQSADNNNGTYHCDNADGDRLLNTWAWGYPVTQGIKGLPQGIYRLKALVTSSDDCTAVQLIADGGITDLQDNRLGWMHKAIVLETNVADGRKQTWLTEGEMLFPVVSDSLAIGAAGSDADGVSYIEGGRWWFKADNFRLEYLGNSADAYDMWRQECEYYEKEELDEDEVFAQTQLVQDFNAALDDFKNKSAVEDILYAFKGIVVLSDSLDNNIAAYAAYENEVKSIKDELASFEGVGKYVDLAKEYTGTNEFEPNEELDSEVEGYESFPNGSYAYIKENEQLTTPQIKAEKDYAFALWAAVKSHSSFDGMDFTSSIVNPTFSDANGTGWTWVNTLVGNFNRTGGYAEMPCAEAWRGGNLLFDVYQDVNNVPDGIYEINASAFYRPNGKSDINPEGQKIQAYIYMNDFESAVKHIGAEGEGISQDVWDGGKQDEVVCGKALNTNDQGWALCESTGYYYPDGMKSASQAFAMGMYKQTVYGLVEGGKMRLGIHKAQDAEGTNQWCLFTNFKLTYRAKNETAVSSVLDKLIEDAANILNNTQEYPMPEECIGGLMTSKLAAEASKTGSNDDRYNALIALNAAIKQANAAIDAYAKAGVALTDLGFALDEAIDVAGQVEEVYEPIQGWYIDTQAAWDDMTISLDECIAAPGICKEYIARLKIIGDWTKAVAADEETHVDMTSLIANSNFDGGNINGWTDTFTSGNHGYQSNNVYSSEEGDAVCDRFIEAWKSGNAALDNGSVSTTIGETGYQFLPQLPAGEYILKADAQAKNQGDENISGGVFLYANVGSLTYEIELTETALKTWEVPFTIGDNDKEVTIGIKTVDTGCNWFTADNFKIIICNYGVDPNAIDEVTSTVAKTQKGIYNMAGQRVAKAQKGVYIINGVKVLK